MCYDCRISHHLFCKESRSSDHRYQWSAILKSTNWHFMANTSTTIPVAYQPTQTMISYQMPSNMFDICTIMYLWKFPQCIFYLCNKHQFSKHLKKDIFSIVIFITSWVHTRNNIQKCLIQIFDWTFLEEFNNLTGMWKVNSIKKRFHEG